MWNINNSMWKCEYSAWNGRPATWNNDYSMWNGCYSMQNTNDSQPPKYDYQQESSGSTRKNNYETPHSPVAFITGWQSGMVLPQSAQHNEVLRRRLSPHKHHKRHLQSRFNKTSHCVVKQAV